MILLGIFRKVLYGLDFRKTFKMSVIINFQGGIFVGNRLARATVTEKS